MAENAQTLAAPLTAQIKKSYDKVTVDKAKWKQIMVTALLFGKAVVVVAKTTINKVQTIENRVYRYLLGVAIYVTVAELRKEIGASRMETIVMETMLMYEKDTLTGNFEQINMYNDHVIQTERGEWIRTART